MRKLRNLVIAMSLASVPAAASAAEYEIDASHSSAQFRIRHLMVTNVKGEFTKLTGTVVFDEKNPSKSTVEAIIDAASIDTRDAKRDAHLKSADFFDVAKYPTITFRSTKVEPAGPGKLKVTGNLTMHGVTRPVVLDVEGPTAEVQDPWGNVKVGASATTRLDRKEFGLIYNAPLAGGGLLIGEEVTVELELELAKKKSPVAGK